MGKVWKREPVNTLIIAKVDDHQFLFFFFVKGYVKLRGVTVSVFVEFVIQRIGMSVSVYDSSVLKMHSCTSSVFNAINNIRLFQTTLRCWPLVFYLILYTPMRMRETVSCFLVHLTSNFSGNSLLLTWELPPFSKYFFSMYIYSCISRASLKRQQKIFRVMIRIHSQVQNCDLHLAILSATYGRFVNLH